MDEVKEVVRGFFEKVFEAVSYVVATVIILTALELEERLKSEWDSVWRCRQFDEG